MATRLGELILRAGLITEQQLQQALAEQKRTGGRLGSILVASGFVQEEDITELLSEQYGVPSINLSHFEIDPAVVKLVPAAVARKYFLIPINRTGSTLTIAIADPSNVSAIDDINFMTGYHVEPVVASEMAIREAIDKYYGAGKGLALYTGSKNGPGESGEEMDDFGSVDYRPTEDSAAATATAAESIDDGSQVDEDVHDFTELIGDAVEEIEVVSGKDDMDVDLMGAEEAPIIRLTNGILMKAVKLGVSDIHFEPYEKTFRVRYRLDGVLYKELTLPLEIKNAITSRLKIMAALDIAERRLPQDGRIKLKLSKKRDIDFRVSCLPTLYGEKVVLRLLDKSNLQLDMTKLGLDDFQLERVVEALDKPYGMFLVTGPTGSGKSTTLYSALAKLNTEENNISTAEDPVEYNMFGVNQVQMREEIGLNFASSLRAFLRQDPDIIMVGEIRDFETAEIAIKAALTGHLVLSTLHTNDAPSTVNRLLNMGIEPFLVSSSVILIVAQRLIRKICTECKEPYRVESEVLINFGFTEEESESTTVYRGKGCGRCAGKGYKGRVALYEVMKITDDMRELIVRGATNIELRELAIEEKMDTLRRSGIKKIIQGMTTLEEVAAVTVGI
jgi:type IV pilus assembly protein PilB